MVDENDELIVRRRFDVIFGAVAAEDAVAVLLVIDVAAHRFQIEPAAGHNRDVDSAVVIAVDQHDMLVEFPGSSDITSSWNLTRDGRLSASITPMTSAPTSWITRAVMRVATSLTVSIFSSTHPIQSPRPLATTSRPPDFGRFTRWPRFWRSMANSPPSSDLSIPRPFISMTIFFLSAA